MPHLITAKGSPQRTRVRCPLCLAALRPGLLWLGGRDYLTCPDCDGTQWVTLYEQRVPRPPARFQVVQTANNGEG